MPTRPALVLVVAVLLTALGACGEGATTSGQTATPTASRGPSPSALPSAGPLHGPLHTVGAALVDAGGTTVLLRGAQIQSYNVVANYRTTTWLNAPAFAAMRSWGMNELRLPFSACLVTTDPSYLSRLVQITRTAEAAGLYVVLAMFGDDRSGCPIDSIGLPHPYALNQWAQVAAAFRDDPNVLFDLFNEPHTAYGPPTDADWILWRDGGSVNDASGAAVAVVGLEQLAEAVRHAGATTQPLVAGAMNLYDLSGVRSHTIADGNVLYSMHTYFQDGDLTSNSWDHLFGSVSQTLPVFVGEWAFLPNGQYSGMCQDLHLSTTAAAVLVESFLAYMDAHGVSYNAWSFTPTRLIVDETKFTPTTLPDPLICSQSLTSAGIGALYKAHLTSLAPSH